MRILYVLHQFFPEYHGGTERVALNLARMAQRAGHYAHILAGTVDTDACEGHATDSPMAGCFESVYQGLPVTFLPKALLPVTSDYSLDVEEGVVLALTDWMNQKCFDVAHVVHTMRMGSAVLALQRNKIPFALTLTDFYLPCFRVNLTNSKGEVCAGPMEGKQCIVDCMTKPWDDELLTNRFTQSQAILMAASVRVAPSEFVAQRLLQAYPKVKPLIQVIPHGIDFLAIANAQLPPEPTAKPPTRSLSLLFVGSIVPQKGLHVLLRALAMVQHLSIQLKVVGGFFGESDYRTEIEHAVAADPRVQLTGPLPAEQVYREMSGADVLCLPSQVPESFSLVFHECAVVGVPAMVSHTGAPAHQVTEYQCGAVVQANDPHAWADAIARLSESPELLDEWRKRLHLPLRIEEESFFYNSLYLRLSAKDAHP